jgi:hypothetical protein
MKLKHYLIGLLLISFATGCIKDSFDFKKLSNNIDWNPNLAVPAVHSRLTLRDLLQDYDAQHLFVEDSTHFLYLIYNKEVFSLPATNYITINDQSFPTEQYVGNDYTSQGFPTPNQTVTVTKNIAYNLNMQLPSDVFDSLILKKGTFRIQVNSTFLHSGLLTATFPTIRKNNLPYSKTVNVSSSGAFNYDQSFNDLTDYQVNMPTSNQIACVLTLTLTNNLNNPVLPTDHADVTMSFSGMQYKIVYGNFGQRAIPVQEDTVNVEMFNNALNGQLYFMNPKIKIHLYNSLGVPLGATFNDFKIYSSSDGTYHTYQLPAQYNPMIVNAPLTAGNFEMTHIILDTINFPTIRTIIYNNPRYFYLQTTAMMNPPTTNQYNFVTDTSRFAVNLEVELPLWGRSTKWIMQDTAAFDFSDYYKDSTVDMHNIDYVKFNINILNAMPTEAGVQLYFTDTLYHIIDSLFTPQNMEIVQSGVTNAQGKVIQATRKITQVTYTGNRLAGLLHVKKILIRGYINTNNQGTTNVRFYSDDYLDVKLGVQVQAHINTQTDLH